MKRGFTLIELLVVVLIIGILSAVALPQYRKAVEKSRLTELLLNNKAIEDALDMAVLENGGFVSVSAKDLVDLSGGSWEGSEYYTNNFEYAGWCTSTYCTTEHYKLPAGDSPYAFQTFKGNYGTENYTDWHRVCITEKTELGRYICKSLASQGWEYSDTYL